MSVVQFQSVEDEGVFSVELEEPTKTVVTTLSPAVTELSHTIQTSTTSLRLDLSEDLSTDVPPTTIVPEQDTEKLNDGFSNEIL